MFVIEVLAAGRNESVLLRGGWAGGGWARLKLEWMGVGILPSKESSAGELSLPGRCRCRRWWGCVKGEGGDEEPAMDT